MVQEGDEGLVKKQRHWPNDFWKALSYFFCDIADWGNTLMLIVSNEVANFQNSKVAILEMTI